MTSSTAIEPSQRRYSLSQLMLLVPWVALVIDAWAPIRDNSFLWHIRAGELQADAGAVLTTDPFSFTKLGESWLTQSWLVELLYSWGEGISGLGFVPWMMLAATTLTFSLVGLVAFRYSRSVPTTALVLLLTTALLISFLVPRPVVFSFALFALVTLAWSRPRWWWTLPLIFWIWASVHGSFVLGLAFIGLTLISEREWRGLPTAIVSGVSTLITAHGLGVSAILLKFSESRQTLALLTEWRRPEWISLVFLPFLVGLVLVILGANRRRIAPRHLWVIIPFTAVALTATRAVPPAWLALVPVVSVAASGIKSTSTPRFGKVPAALFAMSVLVMPLTIRGSAELDDERFPVLAVPALDESPVFHDDRSGGFLIWAEGPDRLVYIDDRAELYQDKMAEFVGVRSGDEPWEPVFERDGIGQALLRVDDSLVAELRTAGWEAIHEDEGFVVLKP